MPRWVGWALLAIGIIWFLCSPAAIVIYGPMGIPVLFVSFVPLILGSLIISGMTDRRAQQVAVPAEDVPSAEDTDEEADLAASGYCPFCGSVVEGSDRTCAVCGRSLRGKRRRDHRRIPEESNGFGPPPDGCRRRDWYQKALAFLDSYTARMAL